MEPIKTITVDGVEHPIESFPEEVRRLVKIHQVWEGKLVDARLEVAMVESALRDLNKELTSKIKAALEVSEEADESVEAEQTADAA